MPILVFKDLRGVERAYVFTVDFLSFLTEFYISYHAQTQLNKTDGTFKKVFDEPLMKIGATFVGFFDGIHEHLNSLVQCSNELLSLPKPPADQQSNTVNISHMKEDLEHIVNSILNINAVFVKEKSTPEFLPYEKLIDDIIANNTQLYYQALTHEYIIQKLSTGSADIGTYIEKKDCRKTYPLLQIMDALNIYLADHRKPSLSTLGVARDAAGMLSQFSLHTEAVDSTATATLSRRKPRAGSEPRLI